MRQPFSSLGNFVSRDILGLPRSSVFERYTNLFIIFLISSLFHVIVDLLQSVPPEYSGSIPFYMAFVFGMMFEDGVQELWGRFVARDGTSTSEEAPSAMWQRIVGSLWVMTWLAITSGWYFTPMIQFTGPDVTMVPFSFSGEIGLPISGTVLLLTGVALARIFEVEI